MRNTGPGRTHGEIARLRDLNQLRVKSETVKSGGKGCRPLTRFLLTTDHYSLTTKIARVVGRDRPVGQVGQTRRAAGLGEATNH